MYALEFKDNFGLIHVDHMFDRFPMLVNFSVISVSSILLT